VTEIAIKPGELRHRVVIQQKTVSKDAEGIALDSWSDVATVWAAVESLRGREYFSASAFTTEVTHRVRTRYRPGITPAMRVLYGLRIFDIQEVIDVNESHAEIQLMCREFGLDG
jgi:SPP1 family predicted phage head-tail adaptor